MKELIKAEEHRLQLSGSARRYDEADIDYLARLMGLPTPVRGVCPSCGSERVAWTHEMPPRRCEDCGDHWAGLYREPLR